jgi:general secretion pathway protein K
MTMHRRRDRRAGFALVIVLWTVAILALMVTSLVAGAGREAKLADTLKQQAVGRAAADGALAGALMDVLRSGSAVMEERNVGGIRVVVTPRNLSGRINPNVVSAPMLAALLTVLGVAPEPAQALAAAIVDWRSPGRVASEHGAKEPQYRAAGLTYGPPNRPFESLDELGYVLGMTPQILAALRPHLTLWTSSDPDPAFADPVVLIALRAAGPPPAGGSLHDPQIIDIAAQASLPGGIRVRRHAVILFGLSPDGRAWRILEWDDWDGDGA